MCSPDPQHLGFPHGILQFLVSPSRPVKLIQYKHPKERHRSHIRVSLWPILGEGIFFQKEQEGEGMNIRKRIDYSLMFDAMCLAISVDIPQMNLYYELGRLICQRTEKGAAVAAAEYLQRNYPNVPGLSPRNLRRMRDFYRMYEGNPELLDLAMKIGWTQNVVILEADLSIEERRWYLCAVKQLGWSKAELQRKIESHAHREVYLDDTKAECYTGYDSNESEESSKERQAEIEVPPQTGPHGHPENWKSGLALCPSQVVLSRYSLLRKTGPPVHKH